MGKRNVAFVEHLLYSRLHTQHTLCHWILPNEMIAINPIFQMRKLRLREPKGSA